MRLESQGQESDPLPWIMPCMTIEGHHVCSCAAMATGWKTIISPA